jgi:ketopantoate reductase
MGKNFDKKIKKNTLIYGGGVIGSFLASCLIKANHKVFFLCRGETYKEIKLNGLKIAVYNNSFLKENIHLKNSNVFEVIKNIKKINKSKLDSIFITTKINHNLLTIFKKIEPYIKRKTLIITPCTSIPFWWYKCLNKNLQNKIEKKLNFLYLKNVKRQNLVGMTMWLSGQMLKPGIIKISHIQRGFPIKEVFYSKKDQVKNLREDISKATLSPKVKDIFSEILNKSINSLAFNMIALKYQQNNKELNKNFKAKEEILKILKEGDNILRKNNIKIFQHPISRLRQTFKSQNHTMSMLHSYKNNKKIELKYLWNSFQKISKLTKIKMPFTKEIYNEVIKVINEHI